MTNALFLKAAIVKNGYTLGTFSNAIEMSRQSLSYKISGKREFTASEINVISDKLNLSLAEKEEIFFGKEVD